KDALVSDSLARKRVEVAIITFGGTVTKLQDFITADSFHPPRLETSGSTPMGKAILTGIEMLEDFKSTLKKAGISYYRPWMFLITDGGPDYGDPWKSAAEQVKHGETSKSFSFFTVGVEDADMDVLSQISLRP